MGDGDGYIETTSSGGDGPGSRLAIFNEGDSWDGDYLAAGVVRAKLAKTVLLAL